MKLKYILTIIVIILSINIVNAACPLNKLKIVQYYFDCKAKFEENKNCILKCILKKLKLISYDKPDASKMKLYKIKCQEELKDDMIREVVECIEKAMSYESIPSEDYKLSDCSGYQKIADCIPI